MAAATVLATFQDTRITEASGLVASTRTPGVVWTHNDSGGEPVLFGVDATGRTVATVRLAGVRPRDWEDLARGPGDELWVGDIGDNRRTREGVLVHRLREPDGPGDRTVQVLASHRLRYPDGAHDAEALLAEPRSGRLVIVTKDDGRVFATDGPLSSAATHRLVDVGSVDMAFVTGGAVSPDGRRVTLRTYLDAREFDAPDGDLVAALTGDGRRVDLPAERQGEAISYAADGAALLTTSEGRNAAIHRVDVPRTPPTTASTSTAAPDDGFHKPERPDSGRSGLWKQQYVSVVVAVVVALVLVVRRWRRR